MFDKSDFCRVCTRAECKLIDIFKNDDDNIKLSEKLSYCVTEAINLEGDELPNLICEKCRNDLQISYTFKKICLKTRSVFCGYFLQHENNKNEEDIQPIIDVDHIDMRPEILSDDEKSNCDLQVVEDMKDDSNSDESEKECKTNGIKREDTDSKDSKNEMEMLEDIKDEKNCMKCNSRRFSTDNDSSCELCQKCFGDSVCSFVCTVCNFRFNKNSHLQAHMRTHTGEKPYKCDLCKERFAFHHHLKRHLKNAHSIEKKENYCCRICNTPFKHPKHLQAHFRQQHESELFTTPKVSSSDSDKSKGLHKCTECNEVFESRSSLHNHVSVHHKFSGSNTDQPCSICGKRFKGKHKLAIHMRVHTGERPYHCDVCGKSFTQSGYLSYHMRIHTGERPYICQICGKNFTQKTTLGTHMRVHEEKKARLSCPICHKTVSYDSTLRRHIKLLHEFDDADFEKFCEEANINKDVSPNIGLVS